MADSIPILSDIFGSKPVLPDFVPTELGPEQIAALQANIAAEPYITSLQDWYGPYVENALAQAGFPIKDLISGGAVLTKQEQAVAQQELSGQVPQDVQDALQRSSAFQNLMGGFAGSSMGGANAARNLGLTSLQLQQQGLQTAQAAGNAAQTWAGLANMTLMNPSSYMVTPAQAISLDQYNKAQQLQLGIARANIAAAPNPIAKGLSDLVAYLTASYIGHGPAGQPPAAPQYGQYSANVGQGAATSSVLNPGGGVSQFGGAIGTISNFLGGVGNAFTGGPQGAPAADDMSTLSANYGAAGMPTTFGSSGYPAAIPVTGGVGDLTSAAPAAPYYDANYQPFNFA